MAKVKFGMMMTDASGKLGGQVFSKNRSGSYVRTKVTPSNPQTASQQGVRGLLGSISSAWSDLTAPQRASFNSAVEDWKKTDIFGDLKKPTGKNLFTALNMNLALVAGAQIVLAPEKVEIPYLTPLNVEIDNVGESIVVATDADLTGFKVVVSATPPLSPGTSFYKGKFRTIGFYPGGTDASEALYTAYVDKFGTPVNGSNIAFSVKVVAPTGQANVPTVDLASYAI